ncbi:adenylate cyclase, terminal-differentiation specific [Ictalurus punctatus]|uniref:Adenylate cyclase, terminal-differentiation specific n=1 Tax=Ictalurus punctatus TaxID=7998 RepID=A0A9F7R720_ICTPU|nr:adenylate cyclase, terminal-differentiation specific [Ictalurus punctatus]XP_053537744.1 adenylate cyclase, terminal-differentiation specific [Ictalurus punctatus]
MKRYCCVISEFDGLSNMQHLILLLGGLFVSCAIGPSVGFFVSQSPSTVKLWRGEPVQVTCSWNISISGVKVAWFKDNQRVEFKQTDKFTETNNNNNTSSTLVINNTDINDAGFYICQVIQDIPRLVTVNGTGTNVTYERENEPTTERLVSTTSPHIKHRDRPDSRSSPGTEQAENDGLIVFAIRCVPFVTLLLAVCFLSRDNKKYKRPRSGIQMAEEQALVIEEENEQMGQEQEREEKSGPNERDEQSGQEGKVEERDEQSGQEGEVEERDEQSGQEGEVEERDEQSGQEGEVEERDEQSGQEGKVEERDEQSGQEGKVEERDELSGQEQKLEMVNELTGNEREVEEGDDQLGQEREG